MSTSPQLVTIDRVVAAAHALGIELTEDVSGRAATATLNDCAVLLVLLDSVLIVRADAETDTAADSPEATIYLAANQVNSSYLDARAIVGNRGEHLVVRTEAEISTAAGLSDAQLSGALKNAFDGILRCQDAMHVLVEEMEKLRAAGDTPAGWRTQ